MSSDLFSDSPSPVEPPYLTGLNPEQRAAVEALNGPVLMLAGAGTGKTRALTTRLAHLLVTGTAVPAQILAVTFTNKAAAEMRERVAALLNRPSVDGWFLGTFHSLAARILRREADRVGLTSNFTILDPDDQLRLLKQILSAAAIDDKAWPAKVLLAMIDRWKDRGLTPDKVPASDGADFANGQALKLYQAYQARLRELNVCDFGDLLLHNLTIFQSHPEVLAQYQHQFRYILVDEYQDTNVCQYLWLRLLASQHHNLCCVGDDDQSIYGWRGAEVGNILRFETDFPEAKVIKLERNYRSTPRILAAASALISHNENRLGKTLWSEAEELGEKVRLRGLWDGEAEARFVGDEIESLQRKGHDLSEIAILLRTGAQTREFEERFITLGLAYKVVGGARFYERREIRDALAYLRVVLSSAHDLAFERIFNLPKRGLGDATLQAAQKLRRERGVSLFDASRLLADSDQLRPQARKSLRALTEDILRWQQMSASMDHRDLCEMVLEESGYVEMWRNDKSIEAPGRLENLQELVEALSEFDTLEGFLEHVSLVMENLEDSGSDQVTLMTLHAAKGLEFNTVFLPGWEEGLFPNQRALDEQGNRGLEEERRLAYVGLTRARQRAIISFAANRRLHGSWSAAIPSRFIDELPDDELEQESDQGLYGAAQNAWGGSSFGQFDAWGDSRTSPGMRRAQQQQQSPKPFFESPTKVVEAKVASGGGFALGERVFHQKFGYGTITSASGDRLSVDFDHAGEKKVMANFIKPAAQAGD
ncbi:ATP-dependent helicase [Rhodovibrionaceae bacterium A322]